MAGLPPLPTVPVLPELPGGDAQLKQAGGVPTGAIATPPQGSPPVSSIEEYQPTQDVDPGIQHWNTQPPQPREQSPQSDLNQPYGDASLPVPPQASSSFGGPAPSAVPRTGSSRGTAVDPDLRATITRVAGENGISPAYALATAERESSFNPNAGGTGTIEGLYQMSGGLRRQYGIAPGADAEAQSQGFARFTNDLRAEMGRTLGRDPTDAETYMGHHFGGTRAARIINGQIPPDTSVQDVFTPRELQGNPHIVRAGTVGNLARSTIGDMNGRLARYGRPDDQQDFSGFGRSDQDVSAQSARPGTEVDLSQFGL
jgi:hypothetical protein